jgi:ABC-type branched-subunit amino acid transport system ATPase component/branched-subunit amino acid ABC-type transport system permease component
MTELLRFALLGLGSGAIYALAAQGIVVIYRGSGVLNFSQGAIGLLSAAIFVSTWDERGWPLAVAGLVAVAAAALTGAVVYWLVMRPLAGRSQLVRLVASLGVLSIIQQGVVLWFGAGSSLVPRFLPEGQLEIVDGASIGYDRLTILAVAVVLTVVLAWYFRSTRLGMATQAINDDPLAAEALGWSPRLVGCVNWTIGAALGGLAGVFIVAVSGLSPVALTLVILPAFAAALASGFRSFALALAYGLALGIGQSLLVRYGADIFDPIPGLDADGWADALPFVLIVVVLVARGSTIPGRGELSELLPRVGSPRHIGTGALVALLGLGALVLLAPTDLRAAAVTSLLLATVGLSIVLLAGYAGQLSLGQMAIAGVAALVSGRLSEAAGLPFLLAALAGVVAAVVVGLLFALPSLRSRGLALAVVTMGLGIAVEKVVFANSRYSGGIGGTSVEEPTLFGWNVSWNSYPERYAVLVVVAFVAAGVLVANVRRGKIGRRLLAVRSNERASASLGISVPIVKLVAFGLGAAIAAVGGVLIGFRFGVVQYESFSLFASLQVVILTVIGGVGYVAGAAVGSLLAPGGLLEYVTLDAGDSERWIILVSGGLLLVVLIACPNGIASLAESRVGALRGRWSARRATPPEPADPLSAPVPWSAPPVTLTAEGVSVRFGGVSVLEDVSLQVAPGRIVGLIGANGAGKTTLLEAMSGYVRPERGSLRVGDEDVTSASARRLARAGIRRSFQGVESFDDLTVRENLLVAHEDLGAGSVLRELVRPTPADLPDEVSSLASRFGLLEHLDASPTELPFGRRRLLGVARAIAGRPSVLLLDEPASGLSTLERDEFSQLLRSVVDDHGLGVLLIEHDVDLVVGLCDEVVVLDVGRVIFRGDPKAVMDDERVRVAYLGAPVDVTDQVPGAAVLTDG